MKRRFQRHVSHGFHPNWYNSTFEWQRCMQCIQVWSFQLSIHGAKPRPRVLISETDWGWYRKRHTLCTSVCFARQTILAGIAGWCVWIPCSKYQNIRVCWSADFEGSLESECITTSLYMMVLRLDTGCFLDQSGMWFHLRNNVCQAVWHMNPRTHKVSSWKWSRKRLKWDFWIDSKSGGSFHDW